jgi:pimeloyl-ACP methyl ester carboxylesterase
LALTVKEIGSFHFGGEQVTLSGLPRRNLVLTQGMPAREYSGDGDFESGQMYAQYVRLQAPRGKYPLLMWHGGGMTGATWETKPDGAPGWQSWFLSAGHDVFVSDAVERGRSGWSRFPEVYPGEPHFRSKRESWGLFRFGPPGSYETRTGHPDGLFPLEHFNQFAKQVVPRWACNDDLTQTAYDGYVRKVGPCVVMTHSQSGQFGFAAARHAPDLVRAVVTVEPSGAPDPQTVDVAAVRSVPHLAVLGDHIDSMWQEIITKLRHYFEAIRAAGGIADIIDLPAMGIRGNSHFPMMDRNSDQVATLVQEWMQRQGLMRE